MMMTTDDGVDLWWHRDGDGPVVLLIPGRGDSSDVYPTCFRDRLLAAGLSVLRFDPRDSGLSGDGGGTYTLVTMADDVAAVLDAAGISAAHVVGLSMGGLILVDLASRRPRRVSSATFLSAMSPDPDAGVGEDFFSAPDAEPLEAMLGAMGSPTAEDRDWGAAELATAGERAAPRPDAGERHMAASLRFGWPELDRLSTIDAPALVIHGTADRVLPVAHAEALARGIATSDLHVVERMGHLPTRREWDTIADLVVAHCTRIERF